MGNAPDFKHFRLGGELYTRSTIVDLSKDGKTRWCLSRKTKVLLAIKHDLISMVEAREWFALTEAELNEWKANYERYGKQGLSQTKGGILLNRDERAETSRKLLAARERAKAKIRRNALK